MNKEMEVLKLAEIMEKYSAIGILDMHKMPARQLQMIRNKLHGIAVIRMSKKSLIKRAMEKTDKMSKLREDFEKCDFEPALLATNDNPFKIYKFLKDNRSPASAKAGDRAPKDIVIQQGPTNLPPGPAISTLQKVGLKASVQGGKIAIMKDKIVCKDGEIITQDTAGVFALLKLEPMEIGLSLSSVFEDGVIYGKSVLDVNTSDYVNMMINAVHQAVNLSVNTGYPTKETIKIIIQKAFIETRALCIETNALEKDFIDEILKKAIREAAALEMINKEV